MINSNFEAVMDDLKERLIPYLKAHNVKFAGDGKFQCINPQHEDSTPSANIVPNTHDTIWHCHGCGHSGTIIHAASYLEGLPASGPGFLNTTLKSLCKRFEIEPPDIELTPEQQELMEVQRAYEDAALFIRYSTMDKVCPQFQERGWDDGVGVKYGIGIIDSYQEYMDAMQAKGYSLPYLEKIDLARKNLFNPNNMIFTIHDHHGMPVGFAARNLLFDKDNPAAGVKYINTADSCPIYRKREVLYGLHSSRHVSKDRGLIIVEGYADWVTMQERGIHNCAAIGGTALTVEHINLINNLKITKMSLCLDNDNGGNESVRRMLDSVIANAPMPVDIMILPDGMDPDDYLKSIPPEESIASWKGVTVISCFKWRLIDLIKQGDKNPEELADTMVPLIMTEPNVLMRERMAKDLADQTGVRLGAILSRIDQLARMEEFRNSERIKSMVRSAVKELQRSPTSAREIMTQYTSMIEQFQEAAKIDNVGIDETKTAFKDAYKEWADRESSIVGLSTGFLELDQALNGLQESRVVGVGGKPNHGKSSLVTTIGYLVAKNNEDAIVLMHSTDDPRDVIFSRLVAIDQEVDINKVTNRRQARAAGEATIEKIKTGAVNINRFLDEGRLVVKDSTHGTTLAYTETMIKYYKERYPDRRMLVIFDNFHKSQDFLENEERIRYKKMSGQIKLLAEKYRVSVIATMEYTKLPAGQRPENSDLSESVQMEYDLSAILHVYNEWKDKGGKTGDGLVMMYRDGTGDPTERPAPIVEVKVGKNKQTAFQDTLFYYFYPEWGKFKQCPKMEALERKHAREQKKFSGLGGRS